MSSMKSLADEMAEHPSRAARVLSAVTGLRRMTDGELATLSGWSRRTVQGKRTGDITIRPPDVPVLSVALDLPIGVFTMTVPEALRWIADNRAEWFGEGGGDGGGEGGAVTTLRGSSPAGVVQW